MTYKPRIVIYNSSRLGVAVGTKMDPNFIVVNLILPFPKEQITVHKERLIFTSLPSSDLDGITSFTAFQQTYPEYFI